jgi:hypothetical protein
MKKRTTCIGVLFVLASLAAADDGDLKPVACDPDQAVFPSVLCTVMFDQTPAADTGKLHPKAVAGTVRGGSVPLKVALDYTKGDANEPDLICFDFTGEAIPLRKVPAPRSVDFLMEFGPSALTVQKNGETFPVTILGMCGGERQRLVAIFTFAPAREGKCTFGDKQYPVRIVDAMGDFRFDEKGKFDRKDHRGNGFAVGETVLVDTGDGTFEKSFIKGYYGQPIFLDNRWYEVTVSPDGDKVSAKPIELRSGKLAIDADKWDAVLEDNGKVFCVSGGKKPVGVPVGEYKLLYYREWSKPNAKGERAWLLALDMDFMTAKGKGKIVTVSEGETTKLTLGSPLRTKLDAHVGENRTVKLSLESPKLKGDLAVVIMTRRGGWMRSIPEAPKVAICNENGQVVETVELEPG